MALILLVGRAASGLQRIWDFTTTQYDTIAFGVVAVLLFVLDIINYVR